MDLDLLRLDRCRRPSLVLGLLPSGVLHRSKGILGNLTRGRRRGRGIQQGHVSGQFDNRIAGRRETQECSWRRGSECRSSRNWRNREVLARLSRVNRVRVAGVGELRLALGVVCADGLPVSTLAAFHVLWHLPRKETYSLLIGKPVISDVARRWLVGRRAVISVMELAADMVRRRERERDRTWRTRLRMAP